jgi:Cu+-exporting ATPase
VWDKTGTLTQSRGTQAEYVGAALTKVETDAFYSLARQSNHPLSRLIFQNLRGQKVHLTNYTERAGKGAEATHLNQKFMLGSADYTGATVENYTNETRVYIAVDATIKGFFKVENVYRAGIFELIKNLSNNFTQSLLSGDGAGEKEILSPIFGGESHLKFSQKPQDKLAHTEALQANGAHVLMIGDGLNDAGALRQSDVGISLSEDVNTFSPACDAILDAASVTQLDRFLAFTTDARRIIYVSFTLSFSYNIIGLTIAAMGYLSPVVCAILMPLSSITIVAFVTLASNIAAKRRGLL